jgi:AMP-binding enzyme C-terminal domain
MPQANSKYKRPFVSKLKVDYTYDSDRVSLADHDRRLWVQGMQSTTGELLDLTARRYGTKKALIAPDRTLRFSELNCLSTRIDGRTVYPAEVLSQFPGIAAAVAVPVAHELRCEMVKALALLSPGASCVPEDVIAYCRERLAPYKVPRALEFVSQLPTGSTVKFIRRPGRQAPVATAQLKYIRKIP